MRYVIVTLLLFLMGCASMPGWGAGYIHTSVSEFDGATEVTMEPTWVCKEHGGCSIKFGLQKRSTMPKNQVVLVVEVDGIHSFSEPSLLFNIDGEITKLTSIDDITDFNTSKGAYISPAYGGGIYAPGFYVPPSNWSSKRYLIDKAFLEKLLSAQRVAVRVNLSKTYHEGLFSQDKMSTAKPAFKNFYTNVFESGAGQAQ